MLRHSFGIFMHSSRLILGLSSGSKVYAMKITNIMTMVHNTANSIIRDVAVSSSIIEFNDHSLAIVDTGMTGNPELAAALDELGYRSCDFKLLINTHLHCDHIGGNSLFKNARILISRKEYHYQLHFERALQDSNDPLAVLASFGRKVGEQDHNLAHDLKRLAEQFPLDSSLGIESQLEYFENNPALPAGISLIPAAGHSIDSHAVCLQGRSRRALAAGDALYHRSLWRQNSVPGINYDEQMFKQNAGKLAEFKGVILPGHDYPFDNNSGKYMENSSFIL